MKPLWEVAGLVGLTLWAAGMLVAARRVAAESMPALAVRGDRLSAPVATAVSDTSGAEITNDSGVVPLARLTFPEYDPPELRDDSNPLGVQEFPEGIRSLHDKVITVEGFVLVSSTNAEQINEILLSRFPPGCCFGAVPVVDEWIAVQMQPGVNLNRMSAYEPIQIRGRLAVGERLTPDGAVESLYRMADGQLVE